MCGLPPTYIEPRISNATIDIRGLTLYWQAQTLTLVSSRRTRLGAYTL